MIRKKVFIASLVLLALVSSLAGLFFMQGNADASHPDIAPGPLDHFLCYTDKDPYSPDTIVGLKDQ